MQWKSHSSFTNRSVDDFHVGRRKYANDTRTIGTGKGGTIFAQRNDYGVTTETQEIVDGTLGFPDDDKKMQINDEQNKTHTHTHLLHIGHFTASHRSRFQFVATQNRWQRINFQTVLLRGGRCVQNRNTLEVAHCRKRTLVGRFQLTYQHLNEWNGKFKNYARLFNWIYFFFIFITLGNKIKIFFRTFERCYEKKPVFFMISF